VISAYSLTYQILTCLVPRDQKVGDSPPVRQRDPSFDINRTDTGAIDRVKEDKSLDEGKKLQEKQERTRILEKSVNSWIGRWGQGGTPVYHEDPGQGRQATKPGRSSEELEGQLPSIAAMAMMGRAMNKFWPCEHQKKGPFVVWKTDLTSCICFWV
jgi:hypothetical protein